MLNPSLASRYAHALHAAAALAGQCAAVARELELVQNTLRKMPAFRKFLVHRAIPPAEKRSVLSDGFHHQVSSLTLNFLFVLVDEKRADYFEMICDGFLRLAEADENRKRVRVETAFPLAASTETRLRSVLADWLHATVNLEVRQKPELLGGVRIQIGDRILDGSLAHRLREIKTKMTAA